MTKSYVSQSEFFTRFGFLPRYIRRISPVTSQFHQKKLQNIRFSPFLLSFPSFPSFLHFTEIVQIPLSPSLIRSVLISSLRSLTRSQLLLLALTCSPSLSLTFLSPLTHCIHDASSLYASGKEMRSKYICLNMYMRMVNCIYVSCLKVQSHS